MAYNLIYILPNGMRIPPDNHARNCQRAQEDAARRHPQILPQEIEEADVARRSLAAAARQPPGRHPPRTQTADLQQTQPPFQRQHRLSRTSGHRFAQIGDPSKRRHNYWAGEQTAEGRASHNSRELQEPVGEGEGEEKEEEGRPAADEVAEAAVRPVIAILFMLI